MDIVNIEIKIKVTLTCKQWKSFSGTLYTYLKSTAHDKWDDVFSQKPLFSRGVHVYTH